MNSSRNPNFRKLRAYAFDPSLSLKIDTAEINDIVYKIPWEPLKPGPIGDYLEVIDYDPSIKRFYKPVDLDDKLILAENGLSPSESNPQYHQQMVYAVAMNTIKNFEAAMGRKVLWSTRLLEDESQDGYVDKLRIYPHALRDANAYYSPYKKALLFGYFSSTPADRVLHMPNSLVLTCLSHDIITHEVTHAILDGMHRAFIQPTNPDVLAFHEAFADIVALFQHFTFPEVLKHQIAKTKGALASENLLAQLAQEFGTAIGGYGSLRDAIGSKDKQTKEWKPKEPNPDEYHTFMEPHARGSILVAAVFEAFVTIYKSRIQDLLRIASAGSGILAPGELHPDLVNRLAQEASKSARHILHMCIRALDYCPPVDITFGDYLRAIITADIDVVAEDRHNYRLAFVEAFRRRGIYPDGITTLGIDSLQHKALEIKLVQTDRNIPSKVDLPRQFKRDGSTEQLLQIITKFLRDYGDNIKYVNNREKIYKITKDYIRGGRTDTGTGLHDRLQIKFASSGTFSTITGLAFTVDPETVGVKPSQSYPGPSFEIRNLRLVSSVGPDGKQVNSVVFSIIQKSGVIVKEGKSVKHYVPGRDKPSADDFEFTGGCTLIFDLDTLTLKYAISKPLVDRDELEKTETFKVDVDRVIRQYEYEKEEGPMHLSEYSQYFGDGTIKQFDEPFAFLHRR